MEIAQVKAELLDTQSRLHLVEQELRVNRNEPPKTSDTHTVTQVQTRTKGAPVLTFTSGLLLRRFLTALMAIGVLSSERPPPLVDTNTNRLISGLNPSTSPAQLHVPTPKYTNGLAAHRGNQNYNDHKHHLEPG